jgi:hypothetical protein
MEKKNGCAETKCPYTPIMKLIAYPSITQGFPDLFRRNRYINMANAEMPEGIHNSVSNGRWSTDCWGFTNAFSADGMVR